MNMDDRMKILLAVSASVGANCHPCLEYHIGRALESGIDRGVIMEAVEVAKAVRRGATSSMDKLALKLLGSDPSSQACDSRETSCCCT
jgi:AhpD family alkylhydroperoxidase